MCQLGEQNSDQHSHSTIAPDIYHRYGYGLDIIGVDISMMILGYNQYFIQRIILASVKHTKNY